MISDPAGVLSRIPELEPLTEDPRVRKAIERGDLHGLYRILFWASVFGGMRKHRETIGMLLSRRRLFLMPIRSAPALMRLNGCGTTAHGRDDQDADDGTYILTQFVSVLFMPLFPLRQYLVRDIPGRGRAWTFIGKVPFGPFAYFWNRALAALVVASVVAGAVSVWKSSHYHDVHLVNGTGVSLHVLIGEQRVDVPADGHVVFTATVQPQHVVVKGSRWETIDAADIDLGSGSNVLVLNLLGAAPVFDHTVFYGGAEPREGAAKIDIACGKSVVRYEDVDDLFVDPPRQVNVSEHSSGTTRHHVGLAKGGLLVCLNYLANERLADAAALGKRVAAATSYEADATTNMVALLVEQAEGLEASLDLVERARAAHPERLELQRLYQTVGAAAGKRDQLVTLYRKLRDEEPASADRAYLLARMQGPAESIPMFDELVRRFPGHVFARRAHAFGEFQLRHFDAALESWSVLRRLAPEVASGSLADEVRALLAVGKGREALGRVEAAFMPGGPDGAGTAALYARVARALGQDGEGLFGKLDANVPADQVVWYRAQAGLAVSPEQISKLEPPSLRDALGVTLAAPADPDQALLLCHKGSRRVLRLLDEETWSLLYAEALRRGDDQASRALVEADGLKRELAGALRAFLETGRFQPALQEAPFEVRAAVQFVRSRVTGLPARERSKLVASARQDDLLHGRITRAIDGWPASR
jgi:hypothetical protein